MTTVKANVLLLAFGCLLAALCQPTRASELSDSRFQFIQSFCMDCHGPIGQEGDFRIDRISSDMSDERFRDQWELVLDYVKLRSMPPEDAKRHPSDLERDAFVRSIEVAMKAADESAPVGKTALRRLNRNEYLNTINDLIGVRGFKLPNSFPPDSTDLPFDTMPEGLFLSPALLDAYLETAGLVADTLVPQRVSPQLHRSTAAFIGVDLARKWTKKGDPAVYLTGANTSPWSGGIWVPNSAAKAPGMYRVRLLASAEGPVGADDKPLRFSFHLSNPTDYPIARRALNVNHPRVASVDVPHTQTNWVECVVPVERGEVIYAFCENRFSEPPLPYATKQQINQMTAAAKASNAPTLRVEAMEVSGPIAPLPRQLEFLNNEKPSATDEYLRAMLVPFAERAYRRPLTNEEADAIVSHSLSHVSKTKVAPSPPAYAIHYGLRRILTSPEFLYLETESEREDDYKLASRLSYFLWSSPPDKTLLDLASKSQLSDPEELRRQVARMIAAPRSDQFVKHFAGQWLENRKAERLMVCDVRYRWSELIRHGFIRSTELFFGEVLRDNLPIATFIDSDFIYANEPMLESWGLPVETSISKHEANLRHYMAFPELKRIRLDEIASAGSSRLGERGGILGLPSVLAATGDGVESSPILRGVWVLENLFGTPAPPPPADVPAIDVDISNAKGVREILNAHKENESCNKCHQRIDPIGLALENYDAIGGWRTRYQRSYRVSDAKATHEDLPDSSKDVQALSVSIDPTGQLPDGFELEGPEDIKNYLLANRELFTRCLTTKLFEYGTGREPTMGDRNVIDQIVSREPESGYRMIDLITELVRSDSFFGPER